MKNQINRRNLLRNSLAGLGGLLSLRAGAAGKCLSIPEQTEGPFYPIHNQDDLDNDLTVLKGKRERAKGEVVIIEGIVRDDQCKVVEGALVEIWQADVHGGYNHRADPNPVERDKNFQFWGRVVTDFKGRYRFKTIIPGDYPASGTWRRPPHIHFKVHLRGYQELTTQMYFKGNGLNDIDHILQSLTKLEQEAVVVDFKQFTPNDRFEAGAKRKGRFDLKIKSLI